MDRIDRSILELLQNDCTMPVAEIARRVGLSTTPCWRRIQKLEEEDVICERVALLSPYKLNVGLTVFMTVKASRHTSAWADDLKSRVENAPQIIELHRLSGGGNDYLLRFVVRDVAEFDQLQRQLMDEVEFADVSTSICLESMKRTTKLPLSNLISPDGNE
ncbi:MAG: Lrp/AsnC family transcriptional regulator [Pseudomonadota bacterium]